MSVNSSSSSFRPSNSFIVNKNDVFPRNCLLTTASIISIITFTIISILLILPLCIYVIYLGFQQWRQQRSGSRMSHSDIFTLNVVVIELINIVGFIILWIGLLSGLPEKVTFLGPRLLIISISAQLLFHSLTCVARYLAVVHPFTYLGLRNGKGIRIRNISIGCVWLLYVVYIGLIVNVDDHFILIFYCCTLVFIFIVISFCSLSVLYVLIGPGPGAGGEDRQPVDQSKMRAFYNIMAILGVLLLRVVGAAVPSVVIISSDVGESVKCSLWLSMMWFTFPSSLGLPLLCLHSAGKLLCCKNSNTSGQGSD